MSQPNLPTLIFTSRELSAECQAADRVVGEGVAPMEGVFRDNELTRLQPEFPAGPQSFRDEACACPD
ncbi:MAG: hypothetical protein HUU41_16755 [Bryobacteraceae bacterium]|nr:hypothetical protein [Bryobacterales bacterium]MEB2363810.1 hypothetical protein [Bryobacterales bacterium]NUN02761.1 hypothetical protein [Bryobacteraceae bacterium]